ncbi:MAG: HDIG domain-containing protein [Chloroflexota bacterium]|nr:HDIG domain-containing protein [Chloroflexota bacterium]
MKEGCIGANSRQKRADRERKASSLKKNARAILLALLLWASCTATYTFYAGPDHVSVTVGEPSPRDIKSPRHISYTSEAKTQQARLEASASVENVYTGPNPSVADQQIQLWEETAEQITSIRERDIEKEEKVDRLQENLPINLPPDVVSNILALDQAAWEEVQRETGRMLALIMREEIRPSQVGEAKRRIQRLTTQALSEREQTVVISLAQALVVPNTTFNVEETTARRKAAQEAVEPIQVTIRKGESILREGELVSPLAMEKLRVLGLLETGTSWQEIAGVAILVLAMVVVITLYVFKRHPLLLYRPRRELLLSLILLGIGVTAHLTIPQHTLLPYLFPTAAGAMLVAILLDIDLAILVSVISAVMVGFSSTSIELVIYAAMGSIIGALTLWRTEQLGAFVRAGAYVSLVNMGIILGFQLNSQAYDTLGLAQLIVSGLANGILSTSLAFVAFSLIGRLFGITTSLQLMELARPNHPLFRRVLTEAPGTYHHSIIISNMAERAAEAVGADSLLARVGSYYHDIGKTVRPYFFAENQNEGQNPHDKLDPKTSAEIIISHVEEGLALARKYKLPARIRDFIPEHHGTTLVSYFYHQAKKESDAKIDESDFRYRGPKPQSKETAIVMLADSCEATVRAIRPRTQDDLAALVHKIINERLIDGQLDECDLTLKDLDEVRRAFNDVLQGIFHPRIKYPENEAAAKAQAAADPQAVLDPGSQEEA